MSRHHRYFLQISFEHYKDPSDAARVFEAYFTMGPLDSESARNIPTIVRSCNDSQDLDFALDDHGTFHFCGNPFVSPEEDPSFKNAIRALEETE